ncbi:helix-turn-helix transcriptional regulator [Aureisphaera galaxeae]|uniref:helix-turn-helix domain-containing protein n=1 Tax=Aureisphaera galaxeae TaxID=1538023 RepID=UPI00234FE3C2|nr:helix-turn-helix transcriptional regulator [Aureisphaera galaxeae]MDC8006382.1 helix-turn-helix transcriptional regulator [Aureisphaera galaxeae]
MNVDSQVLFFFSALGAFNGILLSIYLLVNARRKAFTNYFLGFLLLVLSIRILKSVFFYFNRDLAGVFIQIGLSACILIGPFLYLYFKSQKGSSTQKWYWHILSFLVGITVLGIVYPYVEHRPMWRRWIVKGIYLQWLVYIILTFKFAKHLFKKKNGTNGKQPNMNVWLRSIYIGVVVIWFAHATSAYSSYIVGALSFTFILYLIVLLFIFKGKKNSTFFATREKYKNKDIDDTTLGLIEEKISLIKEKELFTDPNLTLADVAKELNVSVHVLSQFLNKNLGKSFSTFINELRIEKAKELLVSNNNFTIEALGYESGFNSKSTFYTSFKKMTGQSPLEYQKAR